MEGKLLIISAPSGAGKTTIVRHLLAEMPLLEFSISACSRAPRTGEVNGKDYYFLTADDFRRKIENNEFVEWEEVYPGHFYGTLWSELHRIWEAGHQVLFDVDVMGGINLKKKFPNNSLSVFIQPPSVDVLRQRLQSRGTETAEKIEMRVNKAVKELEFANKFDAIVLNDNLEIALAQAKKMVENWLNS